MGNDFKFMLYKAEHEDVSVNAMIKDETIWLTQKAMADLFGVDTPAISKHLSNIYADGELLQDATVSKMETVQQEGSRQVKRTQMQRIESGFDREVKRLAKAEEML